MIGMYKKINRVIEKEKGEFLLKLGIRLFLATDNKMLCKPNCIEYTVRFTFENEQ
ncbi:MULTISPECIES: hypothetical protein [Bacillus]|uniref:hypothetical protein n=1 Tax=Bacillus TaxID=1386 RepID=UPI001680D96A|nr:hypothetical protein [Bacillus wiedmannii]